MRTRVCRYACWCVWVGSAHLFVCVYFCVRQLQVYTGINVCWCVMYVCVCVCVCVCVYVFDVKDSGLQERSMPVRCTNSVLNRAVSLCN